MGESRRGVSLQMQMLIGFIVGLTAGLIVYMTQPGAPWVQAVTTYVTGPIGQIFLRLLFMLVIPLLFAALVVGIAEMGDIRSLRRVGIKTLLYTVLLSSIAVLLALAVANVFEPGAGIDQTQATAMLEKGRENAGSIISSQEDKPQGVAAVLAIIPNNVFKAMADNDILAVMFFALIFGIGLLLVNTPTTNALQRGIEGLFQVAMKLISLVIRLAPIAIACFMFNLAAIFGWDLLQTLALYVGVVLLALGIQMFVVYPAAIALIARRSPLQFFRDIQAAMVVAFSTASSNATLPTSLKGGGRKSAAARPGRPLRPHHRRHRQPERHRHLRRRHRAVPRSILRGRVVHLAAGDGAADVHPSGHRHRWCPSRLPAGGRDHSGHGRGRSRRDRAGPRRRPPARHVPHHPQRDGRPRHRRHGLAR
jgi:DAACS family dicarboxylate/amino acid:cation (Na+ or H+) symporter